MRPEGAVGDMSSGDKSKRGRGESRPLVSTTRRKAQNDSLLTFQPGHQGVEAVASEQVTTTEHNEDEAQREADGTAAAVKERSKRVHGDEHEQQACKARAVPLQQHDLCLHHCTALLGTPQPLQLTNTVRQRRLAVPSGTRARACRPPGHRW